MHPAPNQLPAFLRAHFDRPLHTNARGADGLDPSTSNNVDHQLKNVTETFRNFSTEKTDLKWRSKDSGIQHQHQPCSQATPEMATAPTIRRVGNPLRTAALACLGGLPARRSAQQDRYGTYCALWRPLAATQSLAALRVASSLWAFTAVQVRHSGMPQQARSAARTGWLGRPATADDGK